jgi:exopolyphosphatase/guanosine-5'-triphosphate,3'-diphosphate pyrophosphatase
VGALTADSLAIPDGARLSLRTEVHMPRAAIDIGSNSILLTVVADDGAILHDEARVVGLGRGLGDRGLFAPDRMEAAELALADYAKVAASHGVPAGAIRAVATSGARRAMNAQTWLARVQKNLGLRARIISGEEEARLSWLGARRDLAVADGPMLVVDLGGGSTELVLGEGDRIFGRTSLEIGSVRLTEQYLGHGVCDPAGLARLRNHVESLVATVRLDPAPRTVLAVAGTATTLAAMALGLSSYDAGRVHGSRLTRVDLARFVDRLLPASPEERRKIAAISPERADFLLAGATVLDRVLQAARRPQLTVSDRGLRFGVLAEP